MRRAAMPPAPRPATTPVTASPTTADTGMPIRSASPMARSTAPGARGCSDRTASATKTNGTSASPNATAAALGGAGHEPGQQRPERRDEQHGGHEDGPPLPLGWQRLEPAEPRPGRGGPLARRPAAPHPFTAPAV